MVKMMTEEELRAQGVAFDQATPQAWYRRAMDLTGENPWGSVVWAYPDDGGLLGEPIATDERGRKILEQISTYALA